MEFKACQAGQFLRDRSLDRHVGDCVNSEAGRSKDEQSAGRWAEQRSLAHLDKAMGGLDVCRVHLAWRHEQVTKEDVAKSSSRSTTFWIGSRSLAILCLFASY